MKYVTNGYTTKKFATMEEALEYIKQDLDHYDLKYKKVFDVTNHKLRILVYEYYTLYKEVYIIHDDMELAEVWTPWNEQ